LPRDAAFAHCLLCCLCDDNVCAALPSERHRGIESAAAHLAGWTHHVSCFIAAA
jgi:hypothetical protein